ncbi:hypothetical protein L3X38_017446 [Prunus dulcis]|uniref:Uncharacterized protein n=1 Tax=Prunus dulcis TaxID=3755 RepID=A0AAD4W753_PRUDU|nr:hypothetical protein L3X38_017446 [Prunus dulcis]
MRAPIPGLPLKLYLAATNAVVGALLALDNHAREESPIYYLLRHYFLAHKLQFIVKSYPVRYLLRRPVLSGRLARWLLKQPEFGITCTTPRAIKGQTVVDMLALFLEVEESTLSKEVPGELLEMFAIAIEEESWTFYADAAERLVNSFKQVVLEHIPGVTSRCADALATLGSKLSFVEEQPNITVIKKDVLVVEAMAQEESLEESNWRKSVKEKLGEGSNIKDLKDYAIIFGELYKHLP